MNGNSRAPNLSAQVIRSLTQYQHKLSVYSENEDYSIEADILDIDQDSGRIVLKVQLNDIDIERYANEGSFNFDIEAAKPTAPQNREVYSVYSAPAKILKTDTFSYRLECQLPDAIAGAGIGRSARVPFVLGMHADVRLEVYRHSLSINGFLHNLSIGGCLLEIPIANSIALTVDQVLPGITLEFPNGETFFSEGKIRHIRPIGSQGYTAVGIQFINMNSEQQEAIYQHVRDAEREAAYRCGTNQKITNHSPLFIANNKDKEFRQSHSQGGKMKPSIQRGVAEIANQIQIGFLFIKAGTNFREKIFYDSADRLIDMAMRDRKALLYDLASLLMEPDWVRHAVQVAGQLADMLITQDPHSPQIREAVVGALMHTLGKPLLISPELPSLEAHMTPCQRAILKGHSTTLLKRLSVLEWSPSPVCHDILENANERLDGTGYPQGKSSEDLSSLVKTISVIKAVNKLTHGRNGNPGRPPLDAYRWINDASGAYDKSLLVEYIQQYGLYPIGSLAKFSRGYLAWIMEIDAKGIPMKVAVVKNLNFLDMNLNYILVADDFPQIGKLEEIVNPLTYGLTPLRV
ncbi:PilZ domain-containing protein [Salinicola halophyticus]|uniref:PilZ domain-containing protein n=1 Tax=Salinicola halophyticus TaxID=1808881 RepID=UPI003F489F60